jgi:3-oxoacyl-[acyl-carrier protein] reductase
MRGKQPARAAIVTGAGSGMGAATARALAARGYRVVVNYRTNEAGAHETVQACAALGTEAIACPGDVTLDGDCRRLAEAAVDAFGRIDALVNNAGTTRFIPKRDLEALSADDFQHIYATNVIGAFQMSRACVPAIRAAGGGSIVNVSSFAAAIGFGSSIAYAVSKGALNTLTIALARTLAPEIRVNAVCPSVVETPWVTRAMDMEAWQPMKARFAAMSPLQETATAEDVAATIAWLIADARMMTGELIGTDAGMHFAHPLDPAGGDRTGSDES